MLIPNLDFGGAQRVFHDHGVLLGRDFEVTEAAFNLDDGCAYPSANNLVSLNVQGGGGPLRKTVNLIRRVRRLRALKRQFGTRVTISHLEGAHYVSLLSGGADRKILCIHGSLSHDRALGPLKGALVRRVLVPLLHRRADLIVTVSHELARELRALRVPGDRIVTIHNFFDAKAIARRAAEPLAPAEERLFGDGPVLITSGRLAMQKNQAPLLDLTKMLLERRRVKMVVLGDGALRQSLVERSGRLGLRTFDSGSGERLSANFDVYFLGFQVNPFRYIARADLFLLPSNWEGFPMVIGEAMACGTPVLAADCPTDPREFISTAAPLRPRVPIERAEFGKFGVLMPMLADAATLPARLAQWAEEIDALLDDRDRRESLAAAGLRRTQDFTAETCGERWIEAVASLATRSNSST
jgi:glycosyltransferase involved in cell wall biosynthesis